MEGTEQPREKILIVDDSPFNLTFMKDILNSDYDVITALSGKQALEILEKENIDLILSDIIMSEMDGFELCRTIKANARTRNIPIVFVSAMHNAEDETKGLELGAIDYIHKPASISVVKARVKNHLALKKYRDLLEMQSRLDGLTGLANRRYLDYYLEKVFNRANYQGEKLAVLLLDIDYFKRYNDYYGHLLGDDCLRTVGGILLSSVTCDRDFVARYGGEEFVVILPATDLKGALTVAERIRNNIEDAKIEHNCSSISPYVTVSVGVALNKPNDTKNYLLGRADRALYQAKRAGRNRSKLYDFTLNNKVTPTTRW
ncbi:MAG: diguanylate cyclase response regulator [Firmicutes bacterium]|nr:diguanylate cyclase response regulator [Bacillota bacterium]